MAHFNDTTAQKLARLEMVRQQIKARGVLDEAVLSAIGEVPRHLFVPQRLQASAYDDRPLPIGHGQTISQPYIVGLMSEALHLSPGDKVLEIGTGSGYAAAVLSKLCSDVTSIERLEPLAEKARSNLAEAGVQNVTVHCADGSLGWPEGAPYDAIVVTAGAPIVPESLKSQLNVGGRLVIPAGEGKYSQALLKITRTGETTYDRKSLGAVVFVPLIGEEGWPDQPD
ncbi:protein-L-isoaspartate(D-aspartate) O-methyltransferase [Roseibium sp.]|uniref:protein-L-isoaspartate(D-aspartate) O-methyltransferase n=1 Tax=Roseibium sp. TaxID=1936156 RepID=UPI003A972859